MKSFCKAATTSTIKSVKFIASFELFGYCFKPKLLKYFHIGSSYFIVRFHSCIIFLFNLSASHATYLLWFIVYELPRLHYIRSFWKDTGNWLCIFLLVLSAFMLFLKICLAKKSQHVFVQKCDILCHIRKTIHQNYRVFILDITITKVYGHFCLQ